MSMPGRGRKLLSSPQRPDCRSQWLHVLRCGFAAARLLGLWVRIPPGAWMFACCECCLLSGRGLCDEPITRRGESYRLWCVVVCDLETSCMRRPWPTGGCRANNKQIEARLFLGPRQLRIQRFPGGIIPRCKVVATRNH
jgi:hypothetical protein